MDHPDSVDDARTSAALKQAEDEGTELTLLSELLDGPGSANEMMAECGEQTIIIGDDSFPGLDDDDGEPSAGMSRQDPRAGPPRGNISYTAEFLGMTLKHEAGNIIFLCAPRSLAKKMTQWAHKWHVLIRWTSVCVAIACTILYTILITIRRQLGLAAETPDPGFPAACILASILLILRIFVLGTLVLVAGNIGILRRVLIDFQVWLLSSQVVQWTAATILLQYYTLRNPWTSVDVFLLVIPVICLVELILSDTIVPMHHKALTYNAVSTTALFLCLFCTSTLRVPGSIFDSENLAVEVFRWSEGRAVSIAPRGLVIGAVFTMCVYCFKILHLLLASGGEWCALTLVRVPYEITVENLPVQGRSWFENFKRKIHPGQPGIKRSADDKNESENELEHPQLASRPSLTTSGDADRDKVGPSDAMPMVAMDAAARPEMLPQQMPRQCDTRTLLLARNVGFSLNNCIDDQLLYHVLPKPIAYNLVPFTHRHKLLLTAVFFFLYMFGTVLTYLSLCDVKWPGKGVTMLVAAIGYVISVLYNLLVMVRIGALGKLSQCFHAWFCLTMRLVQVVSLWYSIAIPATADSDMGDLLNKIGVVVMTSISIIGFCTCDASELDKGSKAFAALLCAITEAIGVVCAIMQIGIWDQTGDELVNKNLGRLGDYWLVYPLNFVFRLTISTSLTIGGPKFHSGIQGRRTFPLESPFSAFA
jgi:hypothetical protein